MENILKIKGKIVFDPINKTKKHESQAKWKRLAMIMIDGDYSAYYSWFLKKRYDLILNKPIRGNHISFINDSINDIMKGLNCSEKEAINAWELLTKKWNNKMIDVYLDVNVRSDSKHWWLNIPQDKRKKYMKFVKKLDLNDLFLDYICQ
jgi:hypothetical protein